MGACSRGAGSRGLLLLGWCSVLVSLLGSAFAAPNAVHMRLSKHRLKGNGREPLLAFIGVQTSFGYEWRRNLLRETWFPGTKEELLALKKKHGIMLRFIIGFTHKEAERARLDAEVERHGGFLRLAVKEQYSSLTLKTYLFFRAIMMRYNPQYIFKADDDVYIQLARIPHIVPQWKQQQKDYIGCFFRGAPVITPQSKHPKSYDRWVEPQAALLHTHYPTYARGSLYVLSGDMVRWLLRLPDGSLRFFRSEDVSIGVWMAAFNATHYEDFRLCANGCARSAVGVYNLTCNGMCNVRKQLPEAHADPRCTGPPELDKEGMLPMWPPNVRFTQLDKFGKEVPSLGWW